MKEAPDPRAPRDELIAGLTNLGEAAADFAEEVHGVNDERYGARVKRALGIIGDLLALHLPEPTYRVVRDLDVLYRGLEQLQPPAEDEDYAARTATRRKIRRAAAGLWAEIRDVRRDARRVYPGVYRIAYGLKDISNDIDQAQVKTILAALDQFETAVQKVKLESGTNPDFVQQGQTVTFYVRDMTLQINLARMHLTVNDVTLDIPALVDSIETVRDVSKRFRATVTDWSGRMTDALSSETANLTGVMTALVTGVRVLVGMALGEDKEEDGDPSLPGPDTSWSDASGHDRFGLWASFTIQGHDGKPVTQRLRWIPPGDFMTGEDGESKKITFAQGFWMFDTPCTQALWEAVMDGENPSGFKGPTRPVETVSYTDVTGFVPKLNRLRPGLNLSLPSETAWEYACRAGTTGDTYAGPAQTLDDIAWYAENSEGQTHPVGEKAPNTWGLYDMLGNVWESCADEYGDLAGVPADGSARAGGGAADRVLRGGSWLDAARDVRSASRLGSAPSARYDGFGFRCARVQEQVSEATREPWAAGRVRRREGTEKADTAGRPRRAAGRGS